MLEALYLSKSKIRRKLLGLLFSSPKKSFYLSELARVVKTSPGNIQRELVRFLKDQLIRREEMGNLTLYSVNPNHALFPELRSLILKTSGVEGMLKELVGRNKKIQLALLYGSLAKGTEKGESDVDLLLVTDQELGNLYQQISRLEAFFGREINLTVYSSREFKRKVAKKSGFLMNVLQEPHRLLKGTLPGHGKEHSG